MSNTSGAITTLQKLIKSGVEPGDLKLSPTSMAKLADVVKDDPQLVDFLWKDSREKTRRWLVASSVCARNMEEKFMAGWTKIALGGKSWHAVDAKNTSKTLCKKWISRPFPWDGLTVDMVSPEGGIICGWCEQKIKEKQLENDDI